MIGSRIWDHSDLTTLTWDQIHNKLWLIERALEKIVGVTPAFMRPPYGETTTTSSARLPTSTDNLLLQSKGYKMVSRWYMCPSLFDSVVVLS